MDIRTPHRFTRAPEPAHRLNESIRVQEIRLISEDGEKEGIVSLQVALARAKAAGMDLVEVAPNASPPVCRIVDYKKLQYEKQRKQKEARKHQRSSETKEVKIRPNIGEHDYETKLGHARAFLMKGHKVKLTLVFRQREMRRYDVGMEVVKRLVEDVKDIATRENPGRGQMRAIIVLLVPSKEITAQVERQHKEEVELRKEEHERKLREKHEKPHEPTEEPSEPTA